MENVALIVANLFGGLLCVGIGFIIRTGKANFLIAGYNTMDAKEQER